MRQIAILMLFFGLHLSPANGYSQRLAAGRVEQDALQSPTSETSTQSERNSPTRVIGYTLPSDEYRKARHLSQIQFWTEIASLIYSGAILLVVLKSRLGVRFRDLAERASPKRFVQAAIFGPLLLGVLAISDVPIDAIGHWIARKFALSVQGWGSWLWDWSKAQALEVVFGSFLVWILYTVIRRSPRRWWFYFWLVSLPIAVAVVFAQPLVVDPMFHKFEPLAQKNPRLAAALKDMVRRTGEDIPVTRMFWMNASEKSNELNAYVTGIGASKRIVVWDTTIAKMNTPETVFVVGHEMGHYVLNHIWKGLAFGAAMMFALSYLGYRTLGWLLGRRDRKWGIRGASDWASLPALLLLLTIFGFLSDPISNTFSRHVEHQADRYGLEVTHGLTPDSSQVAAQAFQVLGELDLADPRPNPVDIFLFYSHPTISDRVQFALHYDPWANGGHGEFVY